jgi:hypothetical protein
LPYSILSFFVVLAYPDSIIYLFTHQALPWNRKYAIRSQYNLGNSLFDYIFTKYITFVSRKISRKSLKNSKIRNHHNGQTLIFSLEWLKRPGFFYKNSGKKAQQHLCHWALSKTTASQ